MNSITMYCLVDKRPIPMNRLIRRSATCCDECAAALTRMRRSLIDGRKCRLCGAPSTPEQRKLYMEWRRATGQIKPRGRQKQEKAEEPAE